MVFKLGISITLLGFLVISGLLLAQHPGLALRIGNYFFFFIFLIVLIGIIKK